MEEEKEIKLTEEEKARIQRVKDRWQDIYLDNKADEKEAEKALCNMYERNEYGKPDRIIWFSSAPLAHTVLTALPFCPSLSSGFKSKMSADAANRCGWRMRLFKRLEADDHYAYRSTGEPDDYDDFRDKGMNFNGFLTSILNNTGAINASEEMLKSAETAIKNMLGPVSRKNIGGASIISTEKFAEERERRWRRRDSFTPKYSMGAQLFELEARFALERKEYKVCPEYEAFARAVSCAWIFTTSAILVRKPAVMHMNANGEPYCAEGPAAVWKDHSEDWFLNGVRVPKELVTTKAEDLDPHIITQERNAEVRREIVRKIGIERVCDKLEAKVVDRWENYELLMLDIGGKDERSNPRVYPYLKMKNPSIGVYHLEGVAPIIKTVQQALLWRNGMIEADDLRGPEPYDDEKDKARKARAKTLQFQQPIKLT